jgi:UDP-N-acetylmuramoyl-tripeptide--D-alanyl-D-alanine ligase
LATEQRYSLHQAIDDLMQQDLLHSVLLPSGGRLSVYEPQAALKQISNESFLGADLDSRNLSEGALFVALDGQRVDGRNYAAGPLAGGHWVLTRPVDKDLSDPLLTHEVVAGCGVLLCQNPEMALAHLATSWRQSLPVKIVAVTGTNGKTTTKDLLRAMLSGVGKTQATAGNFNNHLGLPLTLLNLESDTRFAVIEMGASKVGEIAFLAGLTLPQVGLITNASEAHLSEFGSLENIIEGKGELLDFLPPKGVAILNADSPGFDRWQGRAHCPVVSWGMNEGDHGWSWSPAEEGTAESLILDGESWDLPLPGRHNAANLCAAILACRALGLADEILSRALQNFVGSDHRGLVFSWVGRTILDDSYNANPASMLAAVQALVALPGQGRSVAVLGAMAELGPDSHELHRGCGRNMVQEKLDFLLAVGETAFPLVDNEFKNCRTFKLKDHREAADWLLSHTNAGDRILLKGSRSSAMEKVLELLQNHENKNNEESEE